MIKLPRSLEYLRMALMKTAGGKRFALPLALALVPASSQAAPGAAYRAQHQRQGHALQKRFPLPQAPAQVLTLPDCLARAQATSPDAVRATLEKSLAEQAQAQAQAKLLPSLAALGGYTATNNAIYAPILDNPENAAVDVRYDAFPFSTSWFAQEKASALAQAASYAGIKTRQDVVLAVESLYFVILKNQDSVADLSRVEDRLKNLRLTVIPRYTMGRAPPFDLVEVKSNIADLSRLQDTLNAQLEADEARLALILGLAPEKPLKLKALSAVPAIPPLSFGDVKGNPALASLREKAVAARLGIKQARSERLPQLVYDFQYGYGGPTTETTIPAYVSTIGLRFNIFDWGQITSQVRQQQTSLSLADNALETQKQALMAGFVQAYAAAQADLAQMQRLESLLPETRKSARSAINRYRRGAMGILEATSAIQLWLNALVGEHTAYYSYLQDLALLQNLAGIGTPDSAKIYE